MSMTDAAEFAYGDASFEPGASGYPIPEIDDAVERGLIVTGGTASVTAPSVSTTLEPYDAVFLPDGTECTLEATGDAPFTFLWGAASDEKDSELSETAVFDHDNEVQVVKTTREVDPIITINEGHSERYWVPVCPEVTGSHHMGMGILQRPPGSVAPLHEHDPPTLTEAFGVVDGRMQVTDQDGTEFIVEPGDFIYIPEYGMHTNKNVGTEKMTYAFIESPARSRELIAEREQEWYEE
jgi:mannose-6-phosphate isomerase-like protein (cupin superfamily)